MSKTTSRLVKIFVVVIVLFLIALPKISFLWQETSSAGILPGAGQFALTVTGHIIKTEKLDNIIKITGTILANESVELSSEISGRVEQIHFREGQYVKAGALLVSLNNDEPL